MFANYPTLEQTTNGWMLKSSISFDADWVWGEAPFSLEVHYPKAIGDHLDPSNGDFLFAAMLPIAMRLGEALEIDATVSGKLLDNCWDLQSILLACDRQLQRIEVATRSERVDLPSARAGRGLFFSGGLDSSYSLAKNLSGLPPRAGRFTHLLTVIGFDVLAWEEARAQPMIDATEQVAKRHGLDHVVVRTNLRELSDRVVDWLNVYHGAALAAMGLPLASLLRTLNIASSAAYDQQMLLGSSTFLDPLWSTGRLRFIHDGSETERLGKARFLTSFPDLVRQLRVCTIETDSPVYNCGLCAKCLRTMIDLQIVGLLEVSDEFPDAIDTDAVRAMPLKPMPIPLSKRWFYEDITELSKSGKHPELLQALLENINRNRDSLIAVAAGVPVDE